MALVDVVSSEMSSGQLTYKFPRQDLRNGSQLIVHEGQVAIFVEDGKVTELYTSGRYTIATDNIPLINRLINLPFGGRSPFKAEIWFFNLTCTLDSKWGTPKPMQIEDPKYEVIVPVRAFGQYGIRILEPQIFYEKLVGYVSSFENATLASYFKGKISSSITNIISDKITKDGISVLQINSHVNEIGEYCKKKISEIFAQYGIEVVSFDVASIAVKEDDPSFIKLKASKDIAARVKITGKDVYQLERGFNVMENAAMNNSASGSIMNASMGLAIGAKIGHQMNSLSENLTSSGMPPVQNNAIAYYVIAHGNQVGPLGYNEIVSMCRNGTLNSDSFIWKPGIQDWCRIAVLPEFLSLVNSFLVPPPFTK